MRVATVALHNYIVVIETMRILDGGAGPVPLLSTTSFVGKHRGPLCIVKQGIPHAARRLLFRSESLKKSLVARSLKDVFPHTLL